MKKVTTIGMILDNSFPPDPRVENEALRLHREGFKVILWCIDYTNGQKSTENYKGISVVRYNTGKWVRSLAALAYSFGAYHWVLRKPLKQFITNYNIDILHVHDIAVARPVFKLNQSRVPLVLDLHENRPEIMKFYHHVNAFPGKFLISPKKWKTMEYRYIQNADAVIVVTNEAKSYYIKELPELPGEKIVVVPNSVSLSFNEGVNLNDVEPIANDVDLKVVYIGETGDRRGLDSVIRALALSKKEGVTIEFTVVGQSVNDRNLKSLAQQLDVADLINFEGWQSPDLIPAYIEKSDVGISPIHRNLHHDTTYANKIFQYMSIAKPILVSDCTAQMNIANTYDCGLVFESRNVRDLANKLNQLASDQKARAEMGRNGLKAMEDVLNWENQSEALLSLYLELAQKVKD